ncbi:hypothetical protein ACJA25_02915 [Mycoplasmopsis hyopharyngis]|uniref:hypothetical protein n=1 Tax=Mycoplasmopsis hyopharyngis TaxID=29558 RepID=UPI003872F6C4
MESNIRLKINKKLALSILVITVFLFVSMIIKSLINTLQLLNANDHTANDWLNTFKSLTSIFTIFKVKDFTTWIVLPFLIAQFILKIILVIRLDRKMSESQIAFILLLISFFVLQSILAFIAALLVLKEKYEVVEKPEQNESEMENK